MNKRKEINIQEKILYFMFFLFVFQYVLAQYIGIFSYLDEGYSLLFFLGGLVAWAARLDRKLTAKNLMWIVSWMGYMVCGWLSSYGSEYYRGLKITLLSYYLSNKFFVFLIGCLLLMKSERICGYVGKLTTVIRPVLLSFFIWVILQGIFPDIAQFSALEVCAKSVFFIALIILDYRSNKDCLYLLMCIGMLMSTGKGKAYGAILLTILILFWTFVIKKKINLFEIILGLLAIVILGWNKIYYYYVYGLQAQFPRAMLTKWGGVVANEEFPFGTGWGTFGSHYAIESYSPVYEKLGWENTLDLNPVRGKLWMNDTFWPTVYCESGWIGFFFFCIMLIIIFWIICKKYNENKKKYAAGMICFGYMMVTTLESTSFAHPSLLIMAVVFALVMSENEIIK